MTIDWGVFVAAAIPFLGWLATLSYRQGKDRDRLAVVERKSEAYEDTLKNFQHNCALQTKFVDTTLARVDERLKALDSTLQYFGREFFRLRDYLDGGKNEPPK